MHNKSPINIIIAMYVCSLILPNYCKSGNFHVKIIHVLNIQINLFSWVCDTHENILT